MISARFSNAADQTILSRMPLQRSVDSYYDFENFFHPLIGQLIQRLNQATGDPIAALLDAGLAGNFRAVLHVPNTRVNTNPAVTGQVLPEGH